jgi:hypothetical protein
MAMKSLLWNGLMMVSARLAGTFLHRLCPLPLVFEKRPPCPCNITKGFLDRHGRKESFTAGGYYIYISEKGVFVISRGDSNVEGFPSQITIKKHNGSQDMSRQSEQKVEP